ncbi:MAG: glycosyltransferase family 4 protein [Agarilytica sp.]
MKLALVIDDYMPKSTRVGAKMFHELAIELQNRGCKVTVITPESKLDKSLQVDEFDGVTVWRFKSGHIKETGRVNRAINESLLSIRAWIALKGQVEENTFDGVVYYSPSIFFGGLVKKIKARCNCLAYLVLRDLFPQWVIDARLIKSNSLIAKYFRFFERYSYRQATTIGLMSEKNMEVFRQLNSRTYPTQILRNWASTSSYSVVSDQYSSIRKTFSLEDKVIYFYGGNIGVAQDMPNLMRLAKGMKPYRKAHFLFVGQGDQVELVKKLADEWKLNNFTFLPSVDQNTFKCILSEIDVGLFSLATHHTAHNFPGKLLGYMVESKPILGSVNEGNDLIDIISGYKAGLIHINGHDDLLQDSAVKLLNSIKLRKEIGTKANFLLRNEFSVEAAAESILTSLAKG